MREEESFRACDVRYLPIVASYCRRLGIVEEVDRLCGHNGGMSPGRVVLALILDALSGRTPLFQLPQAFVKLDTELLLGEGISPDKLNDDQVGRVLDRIYKVGTGKVLSAAAVRAVKLFDLDTTHARHDTTSHSVYGDYDLYREETDDQPFVITFGFSKGHRPDLKQLIHSLLCVDEGIPVYSKCLSGNLSDKVVNRNLIPEMVERMAELGQKNFLYVADSALITRENLSLMDDWEKGFRFVSRLPASYKECGRVISKAVSQDTWEDLGSLSEEPSTPKRKPAHCSGVHPPHSGLPPATGARCPIYRRSWLRWSGLLTTLANPQTSSSTASSPKKHRGGAPRMTITHRAFPPSVT